MNERRPDAPGTVVYDRAAIVIVLVILGVVVPARCDSRSEPSSDQQRTGASALSLPEFSLETLDGKRITAASLRGRVVLVNFWATWCPPCVEEVPYFQNQYEKWKDRGLVILGIAEKQASGQGNRSDVRSFAEKHGVTYPLAMSNKTIRRTFWTHFGYRRKLPTSFLINRRGKLVQTFVGAVSPEQLQASVRPLLDDGSGGE